MSNIFCAFFVHFLLADFTQILNTIFNYNGSVNFYMFHGGTNFGFMNGANHIDNYVGNGFPSLQKNKAVFPFYAPDVTSYGMYLYYLHFSFNLAM